MHNDISSRPTDSWALPGLGSGEITLADRANEHAGRQQTMDSGADVRVTDLTADGAFKGVGNFAERKAFAEALGAAAATHYGFAGPEFIRFLLNHENEARDAIVKNLAVWNAVAAPLLGVAPSLQASRVATRLGSLVAPAALAAEVLAFPWGADLSKYGVKASAPASAMFMAFSHVLDIWIGSNGVAYSTQTAEVFKRLRAYYHGAPKGSFILCGAGRDDVVPTEAPHPDDALDGVSQPATVSIRGWRAMTDVKTRTTPYGGTEFVSGTLVYVDFIPAVLERDLGQSRRAFDQALASLRGLKLLVTEKTDALRARRRVDGELTRVIRIKGGFFADG